MAYVIAEPCVDVLDQLCVAVCPVDCIHFEEGVDRMLYIDPHECIDCGACEPECPVSATFAEESVPPAWTRALWYLGREAARRLVDELRPTPGDRLSGRLSSSVAGASLSALVFEWSVAQHQLSRSRRGRHARTGSC